MAIQKYTVSNDPAIYEAWPDLVQTDSGKLICVFSECAHHGNRDDARIVLCESTDRGRSWSEKRPLTERGKRDNFYNCARISKLSDGRLVIICDKVYGDENRAAENHIWFADAEGISWSGPVVLPFCGIVPDKVLELKNGRWIVAAHFMNGETKKCEQFLWYSDDRGMTWSDRVTVASDARYSLCEVSIYECEDETLVAFMRENSGLGYDCLKAISHDHGSSWEGVCHCPIPACHRPVAGRLQSGNIMLTHRYMQGGTCWTQNLFAAFFTEEDAKCVERQLQGTRILPLDFDRNEHPDQGYTGWTQFDDGEIYVVNYIKDNADKGQIRGYSFYEDEFVLK